MESSEKPHSRLEDPQFIEEFVVAYAYALEEKVTASNSGFSEEDLGAVSEFTKLRKLPRTKPFRETLIKVGQDFRLTPDEIDFLLDKFLE
ncbi:MAG: hypothetical protein HY457_02125 [Parcubacteria group bacterium]|nr:hypothetical protein [Parcubacteria group bacterium]